MKCKTDGCENEAMDGGEYCELCCEIMQSADFWDKVDEEIRG